MKPEKQKAAVPVLPDMVKVRILRNCFLPDDMLVDPEISLKRPNVHDRKMLVGEEHTLPKAYAKRLDDLGQVKVVWD